MFCKIEKIKHTKSITFLDENINKMNVKGFEILYKTRRTNEIYCKIIEMKAIEKALSGEAPERAEKLFYRVESALQVCFDAFLCRICAFSAARRQVGHGVSFI